MWFKILDKRDTSSLYSYSLYYNVIVIIYKRTCFHTLKDTMCIHLYSVPIVREDELIYDCVKRVFTKPVKDF